MVGNALDPAIGIVVLRVIFVNTASAKPQVLMRGGSASPGPKEVLATRPPKVSARPLGGSVMRERMTESLER